MEYIALIIVGIGIGISGTLYYKQQKAKKADKRTPLQKVSDSLKNKK